MKIKVLVCDMDGTLFPCSGGIYVSNTIKKALIELQKKGIIIILASARIFPGILPLAKQIHMDRYGGYIIASGGTHLYDVKAKKDILVQGITREDSLSMWKYVIGKGADFGISQPKYMIVSNESEGFHLDRYNCDANYLLTAHPEAFVNEIIWKCSISKSKQILDRHYTELKQTIENNYPYQVIRSTDFFIDIINKKCSKEQALTALLSLLNLSFLQVAAIGDGNSDAKMIKLANYGVTLANGSTLCKQLADKIVGSCEDEGCLELFYELLSQ